MESVVQKSSLEDKELELHFSLHDTSAIYAFHRGRITLIGGKMKRIDHILFQADTDFIAYFDSLPLPGGDLGLEPCNCFGHFIASQARAKKDVSKAMRAIEAVLEESGFNAEQLKRWFFPALNVALQEEALRSSVVATFGPLSTEIWSKLQIKDRAPVI